MKKIYTRIFALSLASLGLLLTGCNKFLDKAPDDRTQLDDIATIKELVTSGYPEYSYVPIFELRSDNMQDKGHRTGSATPTNKEMYEWAEVVQSTYQDSPQGYWSDSYRGIAAANQALRSLSELNVPASRQSEVDETRGEALILRAYHVYMLAQAFTVPYDPATAASKLGLPYPTEPEDVLIKDYERGNLEDLYKQMVKDFEEGFKLVGSTYEQAKFHFTPTSAAAFGTRLYRTLGDWEKVIHYGKIALGAQPELMLRQVNTKYPSLPYYERRSTWGSDTEDCNLLTLVAVSSWTRAGNFIGRYGIHIDFRDYMRAPEGTPNNFLRKNPALPFFGREDYANLPKIHEFFKYENVTAGTGFVNSQFVLFSAEEVLFNMAEAYVMLNQFAEAEALLQKYVSRWAQSYQAGDESFRVTRDKIVNYYTGKTGKVTKDPIFGIEITTFNPFYTTTEEQEMYIRAMLYLKRYTFLHEGNRWLDNRQYRMDIIHNRLSNNDTVEEFYVLRGDSDRYPYQLPSNVLTYMEKNPGFDKELEKVDKE